MSTSCRCPGHPTPICAERARSRVGAPTPSCTPASFSLQSCAERRRLHSFPTRRSSDLRRPMEAEVNRGRGDNFDLVFDVFIDRKSTRLNSSHVASSYAGSCLKKKNQGGPTRGSLRTYVDVLPLSGAPDAYLCREGALSRRRTNAQLHPRILFFAIMRRAQAPTLFPYTTLFRSTASDGSRSESGTRGQFRPRFRRFHRSEEHTSELQSRGQLVCRLLLEKKKSGGADARQPADLCRRPAAVRGTRRLSVQRGRALASAHQRPAAPPHPFLCNHAQSAGAYTLSLHDALPIYGVRWKQK